MTMRSRTWSLIRPEASRRSPSIPAIASVSASTNPVPINISVPCTIGTIIVGQDGEGTTAESKNRAK